MKLILVLFVLLLAGCAGSDKPAAAGFLEKFNVIPMGLFLRQLGGNALDLHFNSVGDVGLRALSVPIAVSTPSMTTNLLKPYI